MKLKINNFTISIHRSGLHIISILFGLFLVSLAASGLHGFTSGLLIITAFTTWFFRDPERVSPKEDGIVLAPADGKIISITSSEMPEELDLKSDTKYNKISIHISPLDAHIQRVPISGKVEKVVYVSGTFVNPTLDKASKENERNYSLIKTNNDERVCVTQISGFIARRIICELKQNDSCNIGEKFGIIKFGSRVEIYLPISYNINVLEGQTMIAGETILAKHK